MAVRCVSAAASTRYDADQ